MRLFGKKKATPSPQQSIHRLRETIEMLTKREEFLEKKIEKELQIAKQNASKNKRGTICPLASPCNHEEIHF
jgi:charged multivesicular body protein 4